MQERTVFEQLADQIGAGESRIIPRIFAALADENEARLLLAASPPGSVAELAERCGLAPEVVESMIDPLFRKGLLFKSRKPDGVRYYRVKHPLQFHDSTAVAVDPVPGMMALWKEFMDTEWADFIGKFAQMLPSEVLRVIPVNVSIEPDAQVLAFEDVKSMIAAARNIAVTRCSCRAIDGACGQPVEVCMQLDRAADYGIERGTGRALTKDEAIAMLEMCEEKGLVHVTENKQALGMVICNCCSDCCINWTTIRTGVGKFAAPSRFRAEVIEDLCNGCELCVDRCFFDALAMEGGNGLAVVRAEKCMGCGLCAVVCAPGAISMKVARPESFVPA